MNDFYLQLIGLEVTEAEKVLTKNAIGDFKFVFYRDRKQKNFDKEIVTAVKFEDGQLILTVCPMLFFVCE